MDPVELRRRNLIEKEEFPFTSANGVYYDSGDYHTALDRALEMAGYTELREEQARRREDGSINQIGIGLSTYVEPTSWGYDSEWSSITVGADGAATVRVGTSEPWPGTRHGLQPTRRRRAPRSLRRSQHSPGGHR